MALVMVGARQREGNVSCFDQLALSEEMSTKVLSLLQDSSNVSEAVVVSTCLRTEIYLVVDRFHEGVEDARSALSRVTDLGDAELDEVLECVFEDAVTPHLFRVAAGLDSAIVGEKEVLGQIRDSLKRSEAVGACGPVLSGLFRAAFRAGRRVRSETSLGRASGGSVSVAASRLADSEVSGRLSEARIAVVGAGEVASGLVAELSRRRVSSLLLANRRLERLAPLAEMASEVPSLRTCELDELPRHLDQTDVVFSCLGARSPWLTESLARSVFSTSEMGPGSSRGNSVLIVDLGVPRNVEASVGELPGVRLVDLDEIHGRLGVGSPRDQIERAEELVAEEVRRFRADKAARGAAPTISALRRMAEEICREEVARYEKRVGPLDDAQREAVAGLAKRVAAKLLHAPITQVKQEAGTPRSERLLEALRTLFEL
jgi:glutamyl-tRNA reductase